jgi:ABC-type dipeptide/oligopeptide/nickel transport system permease component
MNDQRIWVILALLLLISLSCSYVPSSNATESENVSSTSSTVEHSTIPVLIPAAIPQTDEEAVYAALFEKERVIELDPKYYGQYLIDR